MHATPDISRNTVALPTHTGLLCPSCYTVRVNGLYSRSLNFFPPVTKCPTSRFYCRYSSAAASCRPSTFSKGSTRSSTRNGGSRPLSTRCTWDRSKTPTATGSEISEVREVFRRRFRSRIESVPNTVRICVDEIPKKKKTINFTSTTVHG